MQVVLTRFARGLRFESRPGLILPPPPWHLVAQCRSVLGLRAAEGQSRLVGTCTVPSRFGDVLFKQGDMSRVNRLARVLAWYGRAPGFESRSGHVLFPPLCHLFHDQFRCRSHRNKHHHPGFGASMQEKSQRSRCQNHSGVVSRIVTFYVLFKILGFVLKF